MSTSTLAAPASSGEPPAPGRRFRRCCQGLTAAGAVVCLAGAFTQTRQFAHSYLLAFTGYLSVCVGSLCLVMIHHLCDASWSVPIRRVMEHLAFLAPVLAVLFLPIAVLAPSHLYDWMQADPQTAPALRGQALRLSLPWFHGTTLAVFAIWTWLAWRLRHWSLQQDGASPNQPAGATLRFPETLLAGLSRALGHPTEPGLVVLATRMMRIHASYGICLMALTLTLAAVLWIKALEHPWHSAMYGVYYFAGSLWVTLATLYVLAVVLERAGPLRGVLRRRHLHDLAVLFFAFTLFHAYIAFSQYFLIWNAALPQETVFYVKREAGSWWGMGLLLVFGHFLVPFLAWLRADAKVWLPLAVPLCVWAWLMHYADLAFNIMPLIHPGGFRLHYLDLGCLAWMGGVLGLVFHRHFAAHRPYPIRDPRLAEAVAAPSSPPLPASTMPS
ncbi:MAG: hypothetical protein JXQ71_02450 [Verrucomicrobia bacterium]|nr:hypothetical protein [Verrucomicrobiota bacterium]